MPTIPPKVSYDTPVITGTIPKGTLVNPITAAPDTSIDRVALTRDVTGVFIQYLYNNIPAPYLTYWFPMRIDEYVGFHVEHHCICDITSTTMISP